MHRILERQIKRFFGSLDALPKQWESFFKAISDTYEHHDEDRTLLARSLELSSGELNEINEKLRKEVDNVRIRTQELEDTKNALLNVLEDARQLQRTLEEERDRLEAILTSMGEGLIVIDNASRIILMNPTAERMLHVRLSNAVGKELSAILTIGKGGKTIASAEEPISTTLRTGAVVITELNDDLFFTSSSGATFPVTVSTAPLLGDGVTGAVVVFRDATEEKKLEEARSDFISIASHQLRTPLSTVNWYTEMLLSGDAGRVNEEQSKYLEEIYHSNQRMIELVNALLNVSRIELGTFAIEPEPMRMAEVADSVLEELFPQIQTKELHIERHYDKGVPVIDADPKLVRIVFQNLLTNSVKYTPVGGTVRISITIPESVSLPEQTTVKNCILVAVSDSGYGIPVAQRAKIFTKFFRADNVREKETDGTGLGLYIVKSVVEQAGGRVWFESEENKGTVFYVTIPLEGMKYKEGSRTLT